MSDCLNIQRRKYVIANGLVMVYYPGNKITPISYVCCYHLKFAAALGFLEVKSDLERLIGEPC